VTFMAEYDSQGWHRILRSTSLAR